MTAVDLARRSVATEVSDWRFDHAILAPPKQAGDLVAASGLGGRDAQGRSSGWADAHPLHLHARADPRTFLVGDLVGSVSPLFGHYPKSDEVAVRQGRIAAAGIAAQLRGNDPPMLFPDAVCRVATDVDPPKALRIASAYRVRGDGVIAQTVTQTRDPQPRGEAEAWAQALFGP